MMSITGVIEAYLVFVGLMAGSFINLMADRLPRGESIVAPRSHCRSCGRVLNAVDLIPVAGYIIRTGRCATCRVPIGVSSPLVEAVAGALMTVSCVRLGLWPGGGFGVALVAMWGAVVVASSLRVKLGRVQ